VSIVARQFGHPEGVIGRLVGRMMARRNAPFNRWVVRELEKQELGDVARIAELGSGPGIALEEILRVFPQAQVWGIDRSAPMLAQARKRNLMHVRDGRLTLLKGDVSSLAGLAPIDVVLAVHVLYFWHEPFAELTRLRGFLRPGGLLALGYQLRQHMPQVAQTNFPKTGHILYESDDELTTLLREVDFATVSIVVKGSSEAPEGRLALATA
jgi:trans-aconitate methyltransferase